MKKLLLSLIPIVLIILLPLCLKRKGEAPDMSADQLVILSSHSTAIRYEFEQAFKKYYQKRYNRRVNFDWRDVGGTSEVARYLASSFTSAFKYEWTEGLKKPWSDQISRDCMNSHISPKENEARRVFLKSDLSIGVDLLFGGGQYDFGKQAKMGTLAPVGLRKRHPELFAGENPPLIATAGGERWYDDDDYYYGTCFSTFGICVNLDRLAILGYPMENVSGANPPIRAWADLADPRLFSAIGLADPTASGSINKCFEMIVQKTMQDCCNQNKPRKEAGKITEQQLMNLAWEEAMLLLKKIGGNARYLTFSASQVPIDCASGQIAAGMCIDFYGRSQAVWEENHVGRKTMLFFTPEAGSTVSADPIGILRGAPHRKLAEIFLDFVLSKEGQRIWGRKVDPQDPDGPVRYAIHRLPIRQDLYTQEERRHMSAPESDPFKLAKEFQYKGAWTGPYFGLLRNLIRAMIIDPKEELVAAWRALLDAEKAGCSQEELAEAYQLFRALPFSFAEAPVQSKEISVNHTRCMRDWAGFFRNRYQEVEKSARQAIASHQAK